MRCLPRSLAARLLLTAALAASSMLVLEFVLRRRDAHAAARTDRAALLAGSDAFGPAASIPLADLGIEADAVLLVRDRAAAGSAAAVWQLLGDGSRVVRSAAALPQAPGRRRLPLCAVMLPTGHLRELTPTQRAGLLDLLSTLLCDRPVAPGRLRLSGLGGDPADCQALLRWLR